MPDDIYKLLEGRYLNSLQFSLQMKMGPEDFKSLMQIVDKSKEELIEEWMRDHPLLQGNWYVDDTIPENAIYMCDGDVIRYIYEELWLGIKHNIDCKGFKNRK